MRELMRFGRQFVKKPFGSAANLIVDYGVYTGICFFVLFLLVSNRPLRIIDSVARRSMREKMIEWIARISNA